MDEELESLDSENTLYQMPAAGPLSDTDLLYLVQGLGTDRDRKLTLAVLLSWITGKIQQGGSLASILLSKDKTTYGNILNLDGDGIELENAQNESQTPLAESLHVLLNTNYLNIIKYANNERRETVVDADGIRFRHGNGNGNEKGTVLIDLTTNKIVISDAAGIDVVGLLSMLDGLDCKKRGSFERINLGSTKSYFTVSSNSDIDTLVAGTQFAASEGDIVVVRNASGGIDLQIIVGTYDQSLGQNYVTTLKAYCAMPFIRTGVTGNGVKWAPLCTATVEVA